MRQCLYSSIDELKRFRQLIVNTVLATDIFDKEVQALRKSRGEKAFSSSTSTQEESPDECGGDGDGGGRQDDVNRKATVVIEHLIQASDVAHTMQHWHIYQTWNESLFAEMKAAFDTGRSTNDPARGWYQGEVGFFDNYIIPLAKKLQNCGVFGVRSDEYLNFALENRREWANKVEECLARMVEKYSVSGLSGESTRGHYKYYRQFHSQRDNHIGCLSYCYGQEIGEWKYHVLWLVCSMHERK